VPCIRERLTRVLVERGLGIKRLDVAVAAGEKNPNHRFGPRRKIRLTGRRPPRCGGIGSHNSIAAQHRAQGQPSEAHAEIGEK
jgi:hypothetical protein